MEGCSDPCCKKSISSVTELLVVDRLSSSCIVVKVGSVIRVVEVDSDGERELDDEEVRWSNWKDV